ncbi:hypothetical protein MTO96_023989 [Rhipicephalus appendiculatus]
MEGAEVLVAVAPPTTPPTGPLDAGRRTCPWGNATSRPQENVSFADVMSEQLARALENEELATPAQGDHPAVPYEAVAAAEVFASPEDCSDDHALALLLQAEYDREHDTVLGVEERKFNGKSKVSVSFDNYRRAREPVLSDSEDEDEDGLDGGLGLGGRPTLGLPGGGFTTKHDATVCGRRNACRVMELPPGISTGDGGGFDMRLSNHVYNSLKVHSAQEGRRAARLHDKREKATAEQSLDPNTRLVLYKLLNREILNEMNGCISTGKESCVFYAAGGKSEEFEYIREDFRFRERFNKLNPRKVIHLWAEKEMHNLRKIERAGLPCPSGGAPQEAPAGEQLESAYAQTVQLASDLYDRCQLVHADLSEYNLLWHQGRVVIIDVSQAVDRMHPHALEFLLRDCTNVSRFFQRQGLPDVLSPKDLFTRVCGLNLPGEGAELLSQIQNYEKNKELLTKENQRKADLFNTLFEKSMEKKSRIGNESAAEPEATEEQVSQTAQSD